jgi:Pyruvate/2-oxoacid:ferredoxin oxidoreductase delta subunit
VPGGKKGHARVDELLCNGCGVCSQLCATKSLVNSER